MKIKIKNLKNYIKSPLSFLIKKRLLAFLVLSFISFALGYLIFYLNFLSTKEVFHSEGKKVEIKEKEFNQVLEEMEKREKEFERTFYFEKIPF